MFWFRKHCLLLILYHRLPLIFNLSNFFKQSSSWLAANIHRVFRRCETFQPRTAISPEAYVYETMFMIADNDCQAVIESEFQAS